MNRELKKEAHRLKRLLIKNNLDLNTISNYHKNLAITFYVKYFNVNARRHLLLDKLLQYSNYIIPYSKPYNERRKRSHPISKTDVCCLCVKKADYFHHIVLLKNGGRDTDWNRIPICHECHKLIHPWLK